MSYPTQNQPQGQRWQQDPNKPNPNIPAQAGGPQGRQGNTQWQASPPSQAQGYPLGPAQGLAGHQSQLAQQGGQQQMMPGYSQGPQGGQGLGPSDQLSGTGFGGQAQRGTQQQAPGIGMGGNIAPGPIGTGTGGGQWDDTGASGYGPGAGGGTKGMEGTGQPPLGQRVKGSVEKGAGRMTGDQGMAQRGENRQGDLGNVGQGYGGDQGNY